jgi:hypothetical protein
MIDVYVCICELRRLSPPLSLRSLVIIRPFPFHFAVVLDRKQWWLLATSIFDSERRKKNTARCVSIIKSKILTRVNGL